MRRSLHVALCLLDVLVSATILIVTFPLMVLLAALVTLDTGSTPIQWQQRFNHRGGVFKLYRYRTLGPTHDEHGKRLTDAKRTTIFGNLMRGSGLAQLPRLANVIAGDIRLRDLGSDQHRNTPPPHGRQPVRPRRQDWKMTTTTGDARPGSGDELQPIYELRRRVGSRDKLFR